VDQLEEKYYSEEERKLCDILRATWQLRLANLLEPEQAQAAFLAQARRTAGALGGVVEYHQSEAEETERLRER